MSLSKQVNGFQRHELYVGIFQNRLWTSESLCDYFHQLIKGSRITECHFYPCANERFNDYSFAILTFDSISSIDQCITKRDQIKQEHKFIVKRNLREISKDQRPISKYILIHLHKFDPFFNIKSLLTYFGKYGSINQWKILDNGCTFLLDFQDYDSVDCIFLDQPHYLNEQVLSIRKCYNLDNISIVYPIDKYLKKQIYNLQTLIDQTKYSNEFQFIKIKNEIQEKIITEENQYLNILKLYIRLERIQRDLKQDFISTHQINQQLKNQLQETIQKNQKILNQYEDQLEQQQSINKSLENSISNLS